MSTPDTPHSDDPVAGLLDHDRLPTVREEHAERTREGQRQREGAFDCLRSAACPFEHGAVSAALRAMCRLYEVVP